MANRILFATETIKTSQGWFEPGQLMPKEMPDEEIKTLLDAKQAGTAAFDSPLALLVHEARKQPNKHQASALLKGALESVSAESSPSGADDPDLKPVDPTPPGYYPTLETYVAAGYQAENYEAFKAGYIANKSAEIQQNIDMKADIIRSGGRAVDLPSRGRS